MTKLEAARAALERIRLAMNARAPADPPDIEILVNHLSLEEKALLGAIDLLQQSRNAFRSKQVERARKMLDELVRDGIASVGHAVIEVETWALGGGVTNTTIRAISEELLLEPGLWKVAIRGSQTNDNWEGQINGPYGFHFRASDIGPRHNAAEVRAFLSRAAERFAEERDAE